MLALVPDDVMDVVCKYQASTEKAVEPNVILVVENANCCDGALNVTNPPFDEDYSGQFRSENVVLVEDPNHTSITFTPSPEYRNAKLASKLNINAFEETTMAHMEPAGHNVQFDALALTA